MAKKKVGRPAVPEPKVTVFSMKGTPAWRDWAARVAKHCRTDMAKLIDAALVEYAKKRGFSEEPPER